jgi:signal transduction histidine kinase/ligand-binding sensor domain-containing protein
MDLDKTSSNSMAESPERAARMPNTRRKWAAFGRLWLAACLLAYALHAPALEPTTPLASYARQSWVMENGLPQNTVQALAQTRDGFVWLGTEIGLVRFDGNSFVLFDRNSTPALPDGDVRCLLEAHDGALWIGTSDGLARWKDGVVTAYTTKDGLPGNVVRALEENGRGNVVVETDNGTTSVKGTQIVPVAVDKLTSANATGEIVHAVRLAGGDFAQASKAAVELHQAKANLRWTAGKELPGTRIQALFGDREGTLWIGTNGGLVRWAGGKVERLPVTDPLATQSVLAIMEDREGNLWVGTETGGLHILRDERFRTFGVREGLSSDATTTVVEDNAGTLWVGTTGNGLNSVARAGSGLGRVKTYTVRDGLLSDVILSLAAAPNGDLWVGTPDGLSRIRKGAVVSFTSADGLSDDFIRSLLVDGDGSVWIGTRRGLTHWTGSLTTQMQTLTQANGLGSDLVGAMARDTTGSLWVATLAGLSRLQGSKASAYNIANYTATNGLSSNVVTALLPRMGGSMMVGTQDHGWSYWDGRQFSSSARNGLDQTTIHAILDDGANHLWFATENGIARCDCDMAGGCSQWVEFGPADGLRSRETATNSHPSALRSRDGMLWFATPKGLVQVDPAHFLINTVSPPVALVRFAVDDVDQAVTTATLLRVAAGHVHFQFDYAGLSFTAPQKVRYRYMLEGFDHRWTEADARRAAYYTNIPPGRYMFRVQAANNDGVWNTAGAALQFELRPHFYQTVWFYMLLAALAAGLLILLLRLRLLRAEREFRAVLGERNRIAREVHDTLAQGYVGVSVQLEVLSELLRHNKTEAATRHLDDTRAFVREGLADARQSIWALRSQDSTENALPVTIRRATEQAAAHDIESNFSLYGAYRPLPPETERAFLRVAQEAIHNVKKHAGAKHLWVQLEYGPEDVVLLVRDDGQGFAVENGAASPPGHYGLTGMRERAETIKGTLEVISESGSGTIVRLRAPVRLLDPVQPQATAAKEAKDRSGE